MIIRTCKFLVYFKKNIDGDFTSTFQMTFYKLTNLIKGLQEFKSFIEFHGIYNTHRSYVKFSFLNIGSFQWLQAFEVIIVMLHWIIEELPIWTFRWLQPSLIWFVLPRFQFSLLTFIEFSIYSRLFYFSPSWNIFNPGRYFSYNCNFIQFGIPSWNFNPG